MNKVVSAWIDTDAVVPGARSLRLRWPAAPGSAALELRFPVDDEEAARAQLERTMAFGDPVFVSILEFDVADNAAIVRYGSDLEERLASREASMTAGELVRLVDLVLAGFEQAHARGLVHPSLSASCIRISTALDGRITPQVIGLGLPLDPERTPADDLTDIAAMAYHLATGRHPNQARDTFGGLLPMAVARPAFAGPPAFEQTIARALSDQGFLSAAQMRHALVAGERNRSGARVAAQTLPRTGQRGRSHDSFIGPLPTAAPAIEPAAERSEAATQMVPAMGALPSAPPAPQPAPALAAPAMASAAIAAPAPSAAAPAMTAGSANGSRRRAAPWIGVVALLAVAGAILFFVFGGGSDKRPALAGDPQGDTSGADAAVAATVPPAATTAPMAATGPVVALADDVAAPPTTTTAPDASEASVAAMEADTTDTVGDAGDAAALAVAEEVVPSEPTPVVSTTTKLTLTSDPSGAEVTEGDRVLGRTPLTTDVPAGRHTFTLSLDGYERDELTIDLLAGAEVTQALELERVARVGGGRRRVSAATTAPAATAPVTTPAATAPATTPPAAAEVPTARLLGGGTEPRAKLLGQDPKPAIKVLGAPTP